MYSLIIIVVIVITTNDTCFMILMVHKYIVIIIMRIEAQRLVQQLLGHHGAWMLRHRTQR